MKNYIVVGYVSVKWFCSLIQPSNPKSSSALLPGVLRMQYHSKTKLMVIIFVAFITFLFMFLIKCHEEVCRIEIQK